MTHDLKAHGARPAARPHRRERGVLGPRRCEALFDDLDAGRGGADRLWTLLVLETWFRAFVDG
jgi:hypothetical protein